MARDDLIVEDVHVSMADPLRVFLCDDVREFRALMRGILALDPTMEVVGEAQDGAAGVRGVALMQPDVVLLDLSMPEMDGLEALPLMRAAAPGVRIIVLSGISRERAEAQVLAEGADAYVEKGAPFDDILCAVRGGYAAVQHAA